jgi:hypothetical protein
VGGTRGRMLERAWSGQEGPCPLYSRVRAGKAIQCRLSRSLGAGSLIDRPAMGSRGWMQSLVLRLEKSRVCVTDLANLLDLSNFNFRISKGEGWLR